MKTIDKIRKNSRIKRTTMVEAATETLLPAAPTVSPLVNIALQGDLEGGLTGGILTIAGPSRHFKTILSMFVAKSWMDEYPDCVMLYYNSEGKPQTSYLESLGYDLDRVVHTPIKNIEELKFDLLNQLEGLDTTDRIIILIDSIGSLASKKEANDAAEGNSAADMTRAKELKSLWRIVTPYFYELNIPCININHVYETMEKFSKTIVSGGQGGFLASDDIWTIGRRQEKEDTDLVGYNFIITVAKSRTVREGSKIPFLVTFEEGIHTHSGLFDIALEGMFIVSPTKGWYAKVDSETGEILEPKFRRSAGDDPAFWTDIIANPEFKKYVRKTYRLASTKLFKSISALDMANEPD